MASDDVWVLGIHMTKFGKHPDKDLIDLASEAVLGALGDAGVTMKDIGVIGAGNLLAVGPQDRCCKSSSARPVFPSTTSPTPAPPEPPPCGSP